jgi:hypothetical protein
LVHELTIPPQEPQKTVLLKRFTRERRSAISNDYIVFLQENEFNIDMIEELIVRGYTDASFLSYLDDLKSQTWYVFILNDSVVSWKCFKQNTIANSTTKAEYIAALKAANEGCWIQKFIVELGVVASVDEPIEFYYDNNGAIAQTKEPRSH